MATGARLAGRCTAREETLLTEERHQALQDRFAFKIKVDPAFAWGVPELTRVIKAYDMQIPICNMR